MKLIYSLTPAVNEERREELLARIRENVPDATVDLDDSGTRLSVLVSDLAEPSAVFDALRLRLLPFGIELMESGCEGRTPSFYRNSVPTKPHRTVRLSTFLISIIAAVLSVSIIAFAAGSGCALIMTSFASGETLGTTGSDTAEDYADKIALIDYIFKEYSLYDADGQMLLDEMLKAYAAATGDLYAEYYTEEEFSAMMQENSGNAVGIGVTVTESEDGNGLLIMDVYPDSPAMKAGVIPGDVLVSLGSGENKVSVADCGYEVALEKLRGEEGSVAEFTVRRGEELRFFSVVRAAIKMISVDGRVSESDPAIGIVRITQFGLQTPAQFKDTMQKLLSKGCQRFVIDVRFNPGGDLRSVKAILSYFLNEGDLVVSTYGKGGEVLNSEYVEPVTYHDDGAPCSVTKEEIGCYRQYPVAVLMNRYSASAAELFASTLRDYELAKLVGDTSFGKGIIQSVFDLSVMGYKGGFKLTVGYYTPPSGENYHDKGITPHVSVALSEEAASKNFYMLTEAEDNQLQAALATLKP